LKKNKILHIITSLERGGAEGALSRLIIFDKNKTHVVVALRNNGYYELILRNNGISVYSLNFQKNLGVFFEFIKLLQIIVTENPSLIQTWLYHADFLGSLAAKILGIKKLAWGIRTSKITLVISNSVVLKLLWILARMSPFFPSKIASCSIVAIKEHVALGYREDKFTVIPNGYDSNLFSYNEKAKVHLRSLWGIEDSEILLGCIARWDPFKDHENLFRALTFLKSNRSIKCVLMGGYMNIDNRKLIELLKQYKLLGRVIFVSTELNVVDVMSSLDFLVLSSVSEGFPNVLAEAMLCEVPVISTEVGDARLIVDDLGWLVPPSDPLLLAKAIDEAVAIFDSIKYKELKFLSRKRIIENFPMARMAREFHAFWDSIIDLK